MIKSSSRSNNSFRLSFASSLLVLGACLAASALQAGPDPDRWWPVQTLPKALVRTSNQQDFPEPRIPLQMMVQSVAGLAAKAVNEGRGSELIWVDNGGGDLEKWRARFLAQHPSVTNAGVFGPWQLVDRCSSQGIIKGYILYRFDHSRGDPGAGVPGIDCSANVATSLAGLLDAVIVDEQLEAEAKAHGLKLLLDARDKTQVWCFTHYKEQFNRRMLFAQDPRMPHSRDFAIAHKVFTAFGPGEPVASAVKWLEPLSPILGWNCGDEFANTDLLTRDGDFQTATDWCLNLPVLMGGSDNIDPPRLKNLDPRSIDWNDSRSAVSFVMTDGDNVQWQEGNFFSNGSYWGDPTRGKIPYGWSCCFDHLQQLCPQALEHALATRSSNDWFIEFGGGYYYPDHFAMDRSDRWDLLARHAQRTWALMKRCNTRMIGFNFANLDSPDTRKACETFARQTDALLAILAFQYYPYEGGAGRVFWVRDANNVQVPVITARYSIWEHSNNRPRAGTPARIAREIRQTVDATSSAQLPRYDWVIDHSWSWFKRSPGASEDAENMSQENAASNGGIRGYSPAVWCADRLPSSIRVIGPEELAWRIRMQHDPAQTQKLISQWR